MAELSPKEFMRKWPNPFLYPDEEEGWHYPVDGEHYPSIPIPGYKPEWIEVD